MDYKEKYNVALERARDLMTKQNPPAFNKDLISLVFPEFKEKSEDEKIVNELKGILAATIMPKPRKREIFAWLEKQGAVWADKHPFSSSREKILAMLDDKYGTDLSMRLKKLDEEYNELVETVEEVPGTLTLEHCVSFIRDFVDELSDVNILIFHIAGIMGVSQDELLSMAVDKIKGREKDPNYKRKHPHK